jgi:cytochrome c-type biogenesis protein CcmH
MGQRYKAQAAVEDARKALKNNTILMTVLEKMLKDGVKTAATPATPAAPVAPSGPMTPIPTQPPAAAPPGPSAQDMAAAGQMTPKQRNEMIRGMVARLADQLKTDGSNVEGWLRLVRSYVVLGERDKAQAAAANARRALGGDADKLRRLEELVKGLGLAS